MINLVDFKDENDHMIKQVKTQELFNAIVRNLSEESLDELSGKLIKFYKKRESFLYFVIIICVPLFISAFIGVSSFLLQKTLKNEEELNSLKLQMNSKITISDVTSQLSSSLQNYVHNNQFSSLSASLSSLVASDVITKSRVDDLSVRVCACVSNQNHTLIMGPRGNTILSGNIDPANSIGVFGDFYINLDNQRLFGPKTSIWDSYITLGFNGPQGVQGIQGLQGVAGERGSVGTQIISGNQEPTETIGNFGDFYIQLSSQKLYGPKALTWNNPITLGFAGSVGPAGIGIQGPPGVCFSNCSSGLNENCCGSFCKKCLPGFACRMGDCYLPSGDLNQVNSLLIKVVAGQFTYSQCEQYCSSQIYGNSTMVMVALFDSLDYGKYKLIPNSVSSWSGFRRNSTGQFTYRGQQMTYNQNFVDNPLFDCINIYLVTQNSPDRWSSVSCDSKLNCGCML